MSGPDIYVEDVSVRPCKRRRLDLPGPALLEDQSTALPVEIGSAVARLTHLSADTHGETSKDPLVCFGMVGYLSHKSVASAYVPR
jgi:hypothetical protein